MKSTRKPTKQPIVRASAVARIAARKGAARKGSVRGRKPSKVPSSKQDAEIFGILDQAKKLFLEKNAEYGTPTDGVGEANATIADRLGNFRRQAAQQGVPLSTAWMFLAGKHIDSIQEYVKDVREGRQRKRTQPISERILDIIVYAALLHSIVLEEGGANAGRKKAAPKKEKRKSISPRKSSKPHTSRKVSPPVFSLSDELEA